MFPGVCCLWTMFWICSELVKLLIPWKPLWLPILGANQGQPKPTWKANTLLSYSWALARRQAVFGIYICLDKGTIDSMDISKHFLNVGVLGAHFALCGVPLVRMLLACCRIWGGAASFPSPSKNSAQQCITKGGWVAAAEESKDTFDSKHACVQMKAMDAWRAKHGKTCVSPACAQAKLSC